VVGILAGRRDAHVISRAVPLVNERADSPANRYAVSSLVLWRAEQKLADEGLEVVGYYHSHPDVSARWSDYDRDHALPNTSYLITSIVRGEVADTRSWRLREDRGAMDEEPLAPED
jgi:proteasome lid subunit RPN8/RPN11